MAAVEQAAGGAAIRYRGAFSRDDVASAALGAITNRLRRAKTGESEPLIIDPAKGKLQNWVNRVVATEAHRLANGSNGREVGGRKRFAEARDAQASLLGRDLTTAEEDDLAEQLREEAPKNSRPSAGYHRRWSGAGSHISIDALPTSEGASSLSERFASPSASAASYEASVARASSRAASVRDDGARARSRTMVWEAYESAMPYAAPRLAGNDPAHAAKDRRAIRSMGGAGEVFAAWRRDELDSDVADRLFAPFADSRTFDRRLEIADTFGEFSSSHQSTLWESASNVASAQQAVSA
jgi:hypothetical protein